jgi:hypothetical protein
MNDNFEKKSFDDDLVSDNTDISRKGEQVNDYKNDSNIEKSEEIDAQIVSSEEETTSQEKEYNAPKEEVSYKQGGDLEEKRGEPQKNIGNETYNVPHVMYSASYYAPSTQQMPPESNALDYAKVLITAYSSNGQTANDQAMQLLRTEARSLL